MRTRSLALLALPLLAPSTPRVALAQDEPMGWTGVLDEASFAALHELAEGDAPELFGEDVEIGGSMAYMSLPAVGPPIGGIVVIHEWWGLNDHVKHWTDRLAADGYAAVAVDLYGGVVATTREEALKAMQGVDVTQSVATMRAAHEFLLDDERTRVERTASIGWCFGGGMSLQLALAEPELDAAIVYYGRLVVDPEQLARIEAPLLGVFGNEDSGIPPEAVAEFAQAMKAAQKPLELAQYDANHAFANPSSANYDTEHAAAAWERSRAFLARHLMPAPGAGLYSEQARTLTSWTPPGWTSTEGGPMRLASWKLGGETECSIIALRGDGGGVRPNLDRWCDQMGRPSLRDDDFASLPRLPMLGTLAPTVHIEGDFTDMSGNTLESATLVGAICTLEGESLFVKLVGPSVEVAGELENFAALCRSLQ